MVPRPSGVDHSPFLLDPSADAVMTDLDQLSASRQPGAEPLAHDPAAVLAAALPATNRSEAAASPALIAANLPDPHLLLSGGGVIVHATPPVEALLGHPPAELIGRALRDLVHPADAPELELTVDPADSEVPLQREVRFATARGGWTPVELRARAARTTREDPLWVVSLVDRTAQRRAEEALRASEERYRRFFEDDLTGDFIATVDGRLLDCNPAFAAMLGYDSVEEVLAVPSVELYAHASARAELIERIRKQRIVRRQELDLRRKDGAIIHVIENVVGLFDEAGELVTMHGYLFDITEQQRLADERTQLLLRERTARALAEAAERRAAFLAEIGNILDTSLEYREALSRLARMVVPVLADYCLIDEVTADGGTRRVAVAHVDPASEALLLPEEINPPDADPDRHPVVRVVRTGQPTFVARVGDEAIGRIAHDPSHRSALKELGIRSYAIVPLLARGRTLGAMTLVSSVSGRNYTAEEVELAEAVARRAALAVDNARLYGRAQQEARTREEVLAFVSHDLRNPLATILLNASAMIETIPEDRLWPDEREQLDWIARSSEQMNRMIQDLLDVTRIDSGRLPMRRSDTSVGPILFETCLLLQPHAQEKGIRILCDDVPSTLTARVDRERFLRVLSNLVGNSIKFTAPGGWVRLGVERMEGVLQFTVADNGVGIMPEERSYIFEPYWQGRRSAPGKDKGSGLGLAIARGIIEAHGGSIRFESTPGEGTTFFVTIPAGSEEAEDG